MRLLSGEPAWIRTSLEPMARPFNMNMHDWLTLMAGEAGRYVLADIFDAEDDKAELKQNLVLSLQGLLEDLLKATSPVTLDSSRDETNRLKLKTIEFL